MYYKQQKQNLPLIETNPFSDHVSRNDEIVETLDNSSLFLLLSNHPIITRFEIERGSLVSCHHFDFHRVRGIR